MSYNIQLNQVFLFFSAVYLFVGNKESGKGIIFFQNNVIKITLLSIFSKQAHRFAE